MSARICMMSFRLPLGRLFHVGGNNDTMVNQTVPALPVEMTRRFSADGFAAPVVRTASYFFQLPVTRGTCALAWTVAPSLLTMAILIGPLNPSPALA